MIIENNKYDIVVLWVYMLEELKILSLVCQRLNEAHIPYMLTGSLAANFYAAPRMTRDIDFVIEILECDASKFYHIFCEDFYINQDSIEEAIKYQTMFNMIHNDSIIKIDFVIRKKVSYRTIEFQRKKQIDWEGSPIWIVAPEDLIISKLLWAQDTHSDYQLRDVKNLLSSTKNLDENYLHDWIEKLGLNDLFDKVKLNG